MRAGINLAGAALVATAGLAFLDQAKAADLVFQ